MRDPLKATNFPAMALMALGAFVYPLAAPLVGKPWTAAALSAVPLFWSLYAARTLWTLGAPQAWAMIAGLALFAACVAARVAGR